MAKATKQKAKNKIAHVLAGFSVGLLVYAFYLYNLPAFGIGLHAEVYFLMPISAQTDLYSPFALFTTHLSLLWQFSRTELLAVLFGLPTPLFFAILAWWLESRKPIAWLHRWYIQLVLAGVSLAALLL